MATSPVSTPSAEAWTDPSLAPWQAQRRRARELLAAHQTRLEQAETVVEQQFERIEEELAERIAEVDRLRGERDALAARLALIEACPAEGETPAAAVPRDDNDHAANDDYQRRYELALSDLRDLKAKNAALQQQFDKANAAVANPAAPSRASGGCLDWEAEKRRILAALEADFDEHNAQEFGERLKIEDVLHTTEQVIAEKDRQIQQLKRQLEEQRAKAAARAPDPAAVDQALDGDAGIQEERQRLKRLQEEWQEKCRQAEIEISLERAKLARQRAELEEQIHAAANDALAPPPAAGTAGHGERPASGRWLAKLGLSDADRERKRN